MRAASNRCWGIVIVITLRAVGKQIYLAAEALYCGARLLKLKAMGKPWFLLLFLLLFFFFSLDVTVDSPRPSLNLPIRNSDMILFMIFLFHLCLLLDRLERVVFRTISLFMMRWLKCLKKFSFLSFRTYISLHIFNSALSFKDLCSCAVLGVSAL